MLQIVLYLMLQEQSIYFIDIIPLPDRTDRIALAQSFLEKEKCWEDGSLVQD